MNIWEKKLLGELVGLARATDGNEHLITESVTQILAEVLSANIPHESQYAAYSDKIEQAKREMVPDCFHCANPCGRTASMDPNALEGESQLTREAKFAILDELRIIAGSVRSPEQGRKLYRGLVILGLEDHSPEELTALFAE